MPKSATWPGGALEPAGGMDGAGSWDSVVSVTSGCSDDSMDFLSAEERACLMFLEETLDSLDTEEDSGLSNDEPDQPLPGNLQTKMAKLSASMDHSRLKGARQQDSIHFMNIPEDHKPVHSFLVPTPLLVASSSSTTHSLPDSKTPEFKKSSPARSQINASPGHPPPRHSPPRAAPSEINAVVIPPPVKPKSFSSRIGETPPPPPRGPLSYDALVHLRRSASAKKSPLRPPHVDHTLGGARPPFSAANRNHKDLARAPPSTASAREVLDGPRTGPPAVAPKPSKAPPSESPPPASDGTPSPTSPSADSVAGKRFPDPQKVRKEALRKLGLLKEEREPKTGPTTTTSLSHTHSQPALDPVSSERGARAPVSGDPSAPRRRVPEETQGRSVQSSASFHHCPPRRRGQNFLSDSSDTDVPRRPQQPRAGAAAENHGPSLSRSVSMGVQSSGGDGHGHFQHKAVLHMKVSEPIRGTAPARAQPPPSKRSAAVGLGLAMLPGMGADRKEALRKLGLLKD
ncbi:unnamed protein product [Boreogadus saida]